MKPYPLLFIVLFFLLHFTVQSQVSFEHLNYQPAYPEPGQKVTISYDPRHTKLNNASAISAVAYITIDQGARVKEFTLLKSDQRFEGTFVLDSTAQAFVLVFYAGDSLEFNTDEGYFIPVYHHQKPVRGASFAHGVLFNGSGNYLFGLPVNEDRALTYMEKEWNDFAESHDDIVFSYFYLLNKIKKDEANPFILKQIHNMEKAGNLKEESYNSLSIWYTRLKRPEDAARLKKEMKEKYPKGNWLRKERMAPIYDETDVVKLHELIQLLERDMPAVTEREKQELKSLNGVLASAYGRKKDWDNFKKYSNEIEPSDKWMLYNNKAWEMVEKGEDLDIAKALSYDATTWAKNEVSNPTDPQPALSKKKWEENRKFTYSMFADTYAFILYKMGDFKNAFPYAKDAVEIRQKKDAEYNERYALILSRVAEPAAVVKDLEPLVRDGSAGKEVQATLKTAYTSLGHSEKEANEYISGLKQAGLEKLMEDISKRIISEPAPTFKLVNLEKKEVSLNALQGKVVVVDFWATWCGPCIASFPAMQRTVDKYKNDPNVVFLFIDTWEKGLTREQLVTKFIKEHNYSFNVLYDVLKPATENEFEVVSTYKVEGIPTKFIIDPSGKIRFKSVGFSGNDEKFIEEISAMIEIASGGKTVKQ